MESLNNFLTAATQAHTNGDALSALIIDIADCTKEIAALVAQGALGEANVKLASQNVQGETQMALDVLSNDLFVASLKKSSVVAGFVSEELENAQMIEAKNPLFLVNFDPLDGSSNVAVNVSVGTIFSILPTNKEEFSQACAMQSGALQIAAGYALYGPATMLVLTLGNGTHGFTLDAQSQIYRLTHANIKIPETAQEYAINMSNQQFWQPPVQRYIAECNAGETGARGRSFNMRWVASMVADVHRILMRGGVYLYPQDIKLPIKAGRLRLLYEANPMSFIVEQASGKSSTGSARIMDVQPTDIHQRIPVILGSREEVSLIEEYHQLFDGKI